ncbi:MAG: hypothetical protein HYS12_23215 [Planctomycetes bacterium]|nr:hypothetical protein [Planctomycetota bacterium]
MFTFKPGRLPAVWADFQGLLPLCPQQRGEGETPEGVRPVYRWVEGRSSTDSAGRTWSFTAIQCEEIHKEGSRSLWAWVTDLEVNPQTVVEVALQGGRQRWPIENQGVNIQKNSGLNLEHAYRHGAPWEAYYYLLQSAHILLQRVEKGSLLRQLAQAQGLPSALALFGSLKNMALRLLESVRHLHAPDQAYDAQQAAAMQIRLDSS